MSDDFCLKGGLARIGGTAVVVMGTVKGHTPGDMQAANYGEPLQRVYGRGGMEGGQRAAWGCGAGALWMRLLLVSGFVAPARTYMPVPHVQRPGANKHRPGGPPLLHAAESPLFSAGGFGGNALSSRSFSILE